MAELNQSATKQKANLPAPFSVFNCYFCLCFNDSSVEMIDAVQRAWFGGINGLNE